MNKMKICLECADGGHLDEMMLLIDAFNNHEIFFVTFNTKMTLFLPKIADTFFVPNFKGRIDPAKLNSILRIFYTILYQLRNSVLCFRLIYLQKPDVIVSTGGPVTIPLFFFGNLFHKKTVYIESITRVNDISGTGKVVYYFSSLFLVQWESLQKKYVKAKYWGRVI